MRVSPAASATVVVSRCSSTALAPDTISTVTAWAGSAAIPRLVTETPAVSGSPAKTSAGVALTVPVISAGAPGVTTNPAVAVAPDAVPDRTICSETVSVPGGVAKGQARVLTHSPPGSNSGSVTSVA